MADVIKEACEACFEAHKDDCSSFVQAVAKRLSVELDGQADAIVGTIRSGGRWTVLPDGIAAAESAQAGKLVIAGLKGSEQVRPDAHGHVVIVVDGPLARGRYPSAYWGSLGGHPGRNQTLNFAWIAADRDRITYAAHAV
jgi:hypothetical protein